MDDLGELIINKGMLMGRIVLIDFFVTLKVPFEFKYSFFHLN